MFQYLHELFTKTNYHVSIAGKIMHDIKEHLDMLSEEFSHCFTHIQADDFGMTHNLFVTSIESVREDVHEECIDLVNDSVVKLLSSRV